jgi:hypothetical protein
MWPFKKKTAETDHKVDAFRSMSARVDELNRKLQAVKDSGQVRYVQLEPKYEGDPVNEFFGGDPVYQEFVSGLLDNSSFQWLIYKRQMQMIDIMNAIPCGDQQSAEMRQRAAYRMDGIQMLINDMVSIKRAYTLAMQPQRQEGMA